MLALEISESSDGAICMYNQLHIFREKASNTPQPLHRSVGGENAGSSVGPARDVRLGDPCVAGVTATRPGTPQLPPCSQGDEPTGFDMALAITPPISKKVPDVAAAPMRKNFPSCALGDVQRSPRTKRAATPGPDHQTT